MAKYQVALPETGDDWLAQQRRKERSFSLRMHFDKTSKSITVEHQRACDAQLVKEMHHGSCDAESVRYISRDTSRSGTNQEATSQAQAKSVATVFMIIGFVFFGIATIVVLATEGDSEPAFPLIFFGAICMFIQGVIRKSSRK